jgi:hypothetical protein
MSTRKEPEHGRGKQIDPVSPSYKQNSLLGIVLADIDLDLFPP